MAAAQQGRPVGDDAVQRPGRHHQDLCPPRASIRVGMPAASYRHAQHPAASRCLAWSAWLGRVQPGVRELHASRPRRAPAPSAAEAVHAEEGGRAGPLPHQRPGQLAASSGPVAARTPPAQRPPRAGCRAAAARAAGPHGDQASSAPCGGPAHPPSPGGCPLPAPAPAPPAAAGPAARPPPVSMTPAVPLVQHADAGHSPASHTVPGAGCSPSRAISTRVTVTPPRRAVATRTPRGQGRPLPAPRTAHRPCPSKRMVSRPLFLPVCRRSAIWPLWTAESMAKIKTFLKQKSKKRLRWYGKYGIIRCAVIGSQGGGTNA